MISQQISLGVGDITIDFHVYVADCMLSDFEPFLDFLNNEHGKLLRIPVEHTMLVVAIWPIYGLHRLHVAPVQSPAISRQHVVDFLPINDLLKFHGQCIHCFRTSFILRYPALCMDPD